jgi:hypothetical protein
VGGGLRARGLGPLVVVLTDCWSEGGEEKVGAEVGRRVEGGGARRGIAVNIVEDFDASGVVIEVFGG